VCSTYTYIIIVRYILISLIYIYIYINYIGILLKKLYTILYCIGMNRGGLLIRLLIMLSGIKFKGLERRGPNFDHIL